LPTLDSATACCVATFPNDGGAFICVNSSLSENSLARRVADSSCSASCGEMGIFWVWRRSGAMPSGNGGMTKGVVAARGAAGAGAGAGAGAKGDVRAGACLDSSSGVGALRGGITPRGKVSSRLPVAVPASGNCGSMAFRAAALLSLARFSHSPRKRSSLRPTRLTTTSSDSLAPNSVSTRVSPLPTWPRALRRRGRGLFPTTLQPTAWPANETLTSRPPAL
jgi:hypothetical protein